MRILLIGVFGTVVSVILAAALLTVGILFPPVGLPICLPFAINLLGLGNALLWSGLEWYNETRCVDVKVKGILKTHFEEKTSEDSLSFQERLEAMINRLGVPLSPGVAVEMVARPDSSNKAAA